MQIYFSNKKYGSYFFSNSTRKLVWFEITKMLIAVFKNKCIVPFIIIFDRLSFPIGRLLADDKAN